MGMEGSPRISKMSSKEMFRDRNISDVTSVSALLRFLGAAGGADRRGYTVCKWERRVEGGGRTESVKNRDPPGPGGVFALNMPTSFG